MWCTSRFPRDLCGRCNATSKPLCAIIEMFVSDTCILDQLGTKSLVPPCRQVSAPLAEHTALTPISAIRFFVCLFKATAVVGRLPCSRTAAMMAIPDWRWKRWCPTMNSFQLTYGRYQTSAGLFILSHLYYVSQYLMLRLVHPTFSGRGCVQDT